MGCLYRYALTLCTEVEWLLFVSGRASECWQIGAVLWKCVDGASVPLLEQICTIIEIEVK